MSFKIYESKQGTDEWFQDRLGKITASAASKLITKTGKPSSSFDEVVNRAVAEIIMQEPDESYQSLSMMRGSELEEQALKFYNFTYDYEFKKCGFIEATDDSGKTLGYGCSPDGIDLDKKFGLELKCPEAHTHLAYLSSGELPDKYMQQVQTALMVTGFETWIFGAYHPFFPCFRVEVKRDEDYIKKMQPIFKKACIAVKEKHATIEKLIKEMKLES